MARRTTVTATAPPAKARATRRRTPERRLPIKVISGGQTGVDRAALDAALAAGIPISGWCPLGRRAEDGRIAARYPLHETPTGQYAERTRWNVRDADATLVLAAGPPTGGTSLTCAAARIARKPHLVLDSRTTTVEDAVAAIEEWLRETGIQVLNVAGPRESTSPGIYEWSRAVLSRLLRTE
jgi:hypothetical protein